MCEHNKRGSENKVKDHFALELLFPFLSTAQWWARHCMRAPSGQKQGSRGSYPFNKLPLEPYALPLYSERDFSAHNSNLSSTHTLLSTHIYTQTNAISLLSFPVAAGIGQLITFFKITTSVRNYYSREVSQLTLTFFSQIYIGCHWYWCHLINHHGCHNSTVLWKRLLSSYQVILLQLFIKELFSQCNFTNTN